MDHSTRLRVTRIHSQVRNVHSASNGPPFQKSWASDPFATNNPIHVPLLFPFVSFSAILFLYFNLIRPTNIHYNIHILVLFDLVFNALPCDTFVVANKNHMHY